MCVYDKSTSSDQDKSLWAVGLALSTAISRSVIRQRFCRSRYRCFCCCISLSSSYALIGHHGVSSDSRDACRPQWKPLKPRSRWTAHCAARSNMTVDERITAIPVRYRLASFNCLMPTYSVHCCWLDHYALCTTPIFALFPLVFDCSVGRRNFHHEIRNLLTLTHGNG